MQLTIILLLTLKVAVMYSSPTSETRESCKKACHPLVEGKINVHLVPHSHDDVGWLKTYDEYYVGTGDFNTIANAGVEYIIDSTITALSKNSDRRFIQVETAFFYKWWNKQTNQTKNLVKDLVNTGQLEMINGGWSMNDEAATHYQSIIDQFTWGFKFLEDTVGECGRPKIGWQIDPFGHSREHASIAKQLGFDGLVVGRIDFRDKSKRIEEKNLDFLWNANDNFEDGSIFTTMFPDFYVYEKGFCFDVMCGDPEITDSNVEERVALFRESLDKYKDYYKTNNIMLPMGHHFNYQKAEKNFYNIDRLIKGFQDDSTYNVIYSTPSCYIQAVKDEVAKNNIQLSVKNDDFFPYASGVYSFWTGYYTSRPTAKRFERLANNILQSTKQLTALSQLSNGRNQEDKINRLRMAMGVMQHHDAITGTEKQAVANDYTKMLHEAIGDAEEATSTSIINLLKKPNSTIDLSWSYCLRSNMSICDNSREERFLVAVHNPLSKTVSEYIRLPVDGTDYEITSSDNEDVKFDIFDAIHSFDFVTNGQPASKELVFLADNLPALGVKLYYFERIETSSGYHGFEDIGDDREFGDKKTNAFSIDDNGKLNTITINGQTLNIEQDFYYYESYAGGSTTESGRPSGAYIFRPEDSSLQVTPELPTVKYARGTLLDEVHQVFNKSITQIIKVYKKENDSYIEFDWLVGDIKLGNEIITKFKVTEDFENKETFYTDSNGRQQIRRRKNRRNDYTYMYSEQPVSSNYYPVTSKMVIRDEGRRIRVAVLNDRAQGGSSLKEGEIELMVHRREKADDGFGVEDVLNEQEFGHGLYARGQHYLTFARDEKEKGAIVIERSLAHKKLMAPVVLVADASKEDLTLEKLQDAFNFSYEVLNTTLPDNVKMLTLEPWGESYVLRLEHIFEKNEDEDLSQDATVDLKNLFKHFAILELSPKTLGANQDLNSSDFKITLQPMEIKTFVFRTNKGKGGRSGASSLKSVGNFFVLLLLLCVTALIHSVQ